MSRVPTHSPPACSQPGSTNPISCQPTGRRRPDGADPDHVKRNAPLLLVDLGTRAPDAKALDGSSTHFYFGAASSSNRSRTWVFFMEGGSDCTDEATCAAIVKSGEGSGRNAAPSIPTPRAPLLHQDPAANPRFWDANHVYLPYMTGDFHGGQRCADTGRFAGRYWFCGHRHLEATIDTLLKEHQLDQAELVIFSGCSTGGTATQRYFRNRFSRVPQPHATQHASCPVLYLVALLVGC